MLITRLWKEQKGALYFFLCSKGAGEADWTEHMFRMGEMHKVQPFVESNKHRNMYWCPHGFKSHRRLKQNAVLPNLLWADLDEVDPRTLALVPTYAYESSPGRFVGLWRTLSPITEELNRRLTYAIGSDKGGWDLTQVLRVPGTTNFKYESCPKVKMLWDDGEEYSLADIEAALPKTAPKKRNAEGVTAAQIYKKYEKVFPLFVRKELFTERKPKPGSRSTVLWRLTNEIISAGCTTEECFELIRVSPWNKFKDRRDADAQLMREIDKAREQRLSVEDDENGIPAYNPHEANERLESDSEPEYKFLATPLSNVQEEHIDWLWYPYLARGELTILEGDPGLGKSYMAQMVAMAICDGRKLPSPRPQRMTKGNVAYFDIENSAGTVTKRRLADNGMVNFGGYFQEEEPFSIENEDALDAVFEGLSRIKPDLVVFDTINTYMGRADTYKASDVTQTFRKFKEIAKKHNCSVLVLRHLTKGGKDRALYRGQGSIAFTGLARVVITVGVLPEDHEMRAIAVTKNNVARIPQTLTFNIASMDGDLSGDRSVFSWGGYVDVSADEIISVVIDPKEVKDKSIEVKDFLLNVLNSGPKTIEEVIESAAMRNYDVSERRLRAAAAELGIIIKRVGRRVTWTLPVGA